MPAYAGSPIFGAAVKMVTSNIERSVQENSFFGVDGVETLDGGFRGRITTASGILFGDSPSACASAVETFRSFDDGAYDTLVDTAGFSWDFVRLRTFHPQERAYFNTGLGWCRNYTATFHHLA